MLGHSLNHFVKNVFLRNKDALRSSTRMKVLLRVHEGVRLKRFEPLQRLAWLRVIRVAPTNQIECSDLELGFDGALTSED